MVVVCMTAVALSVSVIVGRYVQGCVQGPITSPVASLNQTLVCCFAAIICVN